MKLNILIEIFYYYMKKYIPFDKAVVTWQKFLCKLGRIDRFLTQTDSAT